VQPVRYFSLPFTGSWLAWKTGTLLRDSAASEPTCASGSTGHQTNAAGFLPPSACWTCDAAADESAVWIARIL
jgi:hypothetical protein